LGDGLYAEYDGYTLTLKAPRGASEHWVALEPDIFESLLSFVERVRGVKITIESNQDRTG